MINGSRKLEDAYFHFSVFCGGIEIKLLRKTQGKEGRKGYERTSPQP